jgi:hypothetical protein
MTMIYRTCYGSICECGEKIDVIKSGIQKYLRRRDAAKMKRLMKELVLFKFMAKNEKEEKIGRAIFSNMINRIIVMLDEELSFDEINRYLKVREMIEKVRSAVSLEECLEYVYEICDILCCGRICRLNSDIVCYYNKRVFEYGERIDDIELNDEDNKFVEKKGDHEDLIMDMNCFIKCFERRDARVYYYLFKIFNSEGKCAIRYRRKDNIYVCLKWLEERIKSEKIREVFMHKLESFFEKEKKERKMFLVGLLNIVYYEDEIDLLEEVKYDVSGVEENVVIEDYVVDMHCSRGRKMGLNTVNFADEGSLVVDEYVKYKNNVWREYYNNDKKKDVVKNEVKEVKKVVIKAKKVVIKEKKMDELEVNDMGLEEIAMDKFEFVEVCKHKICGSKVACFIVKYEGKMHVMKEGRKSMQYNKDYDMVDKCKEIFGLNSINMRRIISDKVMDGEGNFIEKRAIYSMMEVIDGIKLVDYKRKYGEDSIKDEVLREYVKIGCWRGIFMVSDYNVTNVFIDEKTGKIVSMDEHDMCGKRTEIFGLKNKKYLIQCKDVVGEIIDELMSNYEKKREWIRRMVSEYKYDVSVYEMIMRNFDSLREKVYAEMCA